MHAGVYLPFNFEELGFEFRTGNLEKCALEFHVQKGGNKLAR